MMTTTTAYRDPLERTRLRVAELVEALATRRPAATTRRRVMAARVGRVAFGAVGVGGMLAIAGCAAVRYATNVYAGTPSLTEMLVALWPASIAAYGVARAARAWLPEARPPRGGDTRTLVDRLERLHARLADGRPLRTWSIAAPLAALCLMLPLTLHLAVWVLAFDGSTSHLERYDDWISMSFAIVGHAHLALAGCAIAFARKVMRLPLAAARAVDDRGFKALGITVAVSAVPGLLFLAIPPALVAVTGLAFIPLAWCAFRRVALRERRVLDAAGFAA